MKIYRKSEFLKLPSGTVYFKGKDNWNFGGLVFKGNTLSDVDWYEIDPAWVDGDDSGECFYRLEEMLETGISYPMQNSECRDGAFDEDHIFMVPEKADLELLRDWINTAIALQGKI